MVLLGVRFNRLYVYAFFFKKTFHSVKLNITLRSPSKTQMTFNCNHYSIYVNRFFFNHIVTTLISSYLDHTMFTHSLVQFCSSAENVFHLFGHWRRPALNGPATNDRTTLVLFFFFFCECVSRCIGVLYPDDRVDDGALKRYNAGLLLWVRQPHETSTQKLSLFHLTPFFFLLLSIFEWTGFAQRKGKTYIYCTISQMLGGHYYDVKTGPSCPSFWE